MKQGYAICLATVLLTAFLIPALQAQSSTTSVPAPVPEQIAAAKKVFISNAGTDAVSLNFFRKLGDPNQPYNLFYAAMKGWGRYELVGSPSDAELVFEVRFTTPTLYTGSVTAYGPQLELTIQDARTHFTLWALTEPVQGAFRKGTFTKNVDSGMTSLMNEVKKLAAPSAGR